MDKTITKYQAVTATSAELLTEQVNNLIAGGWQPFGGVNLEHQNSVFNYTQAVVQYSK